MSGPTARIEDGLLWLGEKPYPWASRVESTESTEFSNIATRLAHLPFENGWTLSIIFGSMTYSPNRDHPFMSKVWHEAVEEVEIMVWDAAGTAVTWAETEDTVLAYAPVSDVIKLISEMSTWPSDFLVAQSQSPLLTAPKELTE